MPPAKPPPRRSSSKPVPPAPRASSAGGKPSAGQGAESAKKPARKPEPAAAPKAQAKQATNAQGAKAQAKQAANAQGVKAQAKQAANAQGAKAQVKQVEDSQAAKAQAKQVEDSQAAKAQAKQGEDSQTRQAEAAQGARAQAKQAEESQAAKAQVKQAETEQAVKAQAKQSATEQAAKDQVKPAGKGPKSPERPAEATPPEKSRDGAQEAKPQARMVEEAAPSETPAASPSPAARAKVRPARSLSLVPPLRSDANKEEPSEEATIAEPPSIELEAPAPRAEVRTHTRPPLDVGDLDSEVLPISALVPIEGSFTGAPLLVHASPETIRTWGVLGSTMGRLVPGKSEGGYTFSGQARLFLRAVQRVDASSPDSASTGRCSVVLRNTTGRPIQLQVRGGLFSKYLTPQFPLNSQGEPFNPLNQKPLDEDLTNLIDAESGQGKTPDPEGLFFRGPQAVLASGLLDAILDDRSESEREVLPLVREDLDLLLDDVRLGTRGAFEGSLTVQPGATVVVLAARHPKGVTLSALLDFKALDAKGQVDAGARFRLATVSSPYPLTPDELAAITRSEHPLATAGAEDTGPTAFPPLQGVLEAGSVFVAERTLSLSPGTLAGDLVMSMPRRNAGTGPDAPTLTPTSGTSASRATSSQGERTHDGARGVTYQLTYTLENEGPEPREVELLLTSPRRHPSERFFPQAGVLNLAMKVDGERMDVRLSQRGEGRVLAVLELPPEGRRQVRLEWTHLGGTFPPAGLELRARR
ncbi:hypothetical protein [Myxococcus qinghaiensis]|uniref:hypothetical protein n=1 Tax=Myxococcus qinghaiensis TaxID=2906758 RepID=UPI0020A70628|nr:hypothetical protein [Myxococcus qinghaiensis]MCP3167468.1 hypothetical protein [Myxococcus qinghaiensis]